MVDFNFEDTADFYIDIDKYSSWIGEVVQNEKHELGDITYILCSDDYLLDVNRKFLDHDYYTDIITFDYSEDSRISGDLFISIDRVKENANELGLTFDEEFKRVCIHGVLHLCGYGDKSSEEEFLMRQKEDQALKLF